MQNQKEHTQQDFVNSNEATAATGEPSSRPGEKTFNLAVDDVPYLVKAAPFTFNGETRFYVTVNDSEEHVFTWDSELGGLRAIDDEASTLPDALEEAISRKLQSQVQ